MDSLSKSAARGAYFETTLVAAMEFVVTLLVFRVIGHRHGSVGFAEYAVSMRTLAFLQPPLILGMGIALPRMLAGLKDEDRKRLGVGYLNAALFPVLAASAITGFLGFVFAPSISTLLFGSPHHQLLTRALAYMLLGSCLHAIAYGYLRGRFLMRRANALEIANFVIGPLFSIVAGKSVTQILFLLGTFWVLSSLSTIALLQRGLRSTTREQISDLLKFGAKRIPGELMLFGLFWLPPVVAIRATNLAEAGHVAFAVAIVSAAGSILTPISAVMLPHARRMFSEGRTAEARQATRLVLWLVILAASTGVVLIQLFAPFGIRLYLGPGFADAVAPVRLIGLAAIPYSIFVTLRSFLDAYHERAITMRSAAWAFGVLSAVTIGGTLIGQARAPEAGFVIAMFFLGGLTLHAYNQVEP